MKGGLSLTLLLLRFHAVLPLRRWIENRPLFKVIKNIATSSSIGYLSLRNSLTLPKPFQFPHSDSMMVKADPPPPLSSKSTGSSFVRDAVRAVGPSVARIDCEKEIPPMLALFNENFKEGDLIKISGSGIVVSTDGYLLTNAHVVDGSKRIIITLSNGRAYKASLVSSDELSDLAVLKADVGADSLQKAPIGDSSALVSGDWVIAVGCPVGLDFTVTLGVVSNPKRSAAEVFVSASQ